MSAPNRRILLSCLVIFLVTCLCLSLLSIAGAGYFFYKNGSELLTNISCSGFSETNLSGDINVQMNQIEQQVTTIRGLEPRETVIRGLLTPSELRQHVIEDFMKDYSNEDAEHDALVLAALNLVGADFDLISLYTDLYSEQVAGFYDQETKDMFVIKGEQFAGPERMTYAHEFVHALQDQTYDIQNGLNFNDGVCESDSERCAAVSALLEGDATISEQKWYTKYATRQDCQEINSFYADFLSPVYDGAPEFLQQDFLFPYIQGKDFVQYLLDQEGQAGVDAAFQNPPISTEQILHPERYPGDKPIQVRLPDFSIQLGSEWQEIDRGVMGEWYTYLILAYAKDPETRLDEKLAASAAAGWSGDLYVTYYNPAKKQTVLVLQMIWDSPQDAEEFGQAFGSYGEKRFGKPAQQGKETLWEDETQASLFVSDGMTTTWVLAPDVAIANVLRDTLGLP